MIRALAPCGEPAHWFLCFGDADARWVRWLCFGARFSHVRAFGAVPNMALWVFYDVSLTGTAIVTARDGTPECEALIEAWQRNCVVVHMPRLRRKGLPRWPLFSCSASAAHLVGLEGALRVDGLYRNCLTHGGKLIDGREQAAAAGGATAGSCA